jgi:hypothetical protein
MRFSILVLVGVLLGGTLYAQTLPEVIRPVTKPACEMPQVRLRLWHVDDVAVLKLNHEHTIQAIWGKAGAVFDGTHDHTQPLSATSPGDSGELGITNWVHAGKNTLEITLDNNTLFGTSLALDIWVGDNHTIKERFSQQYGKLGRTLHKTVSLDVPECGAKNQ